MSQNAAVEPADGDASKMSATRSLGARSFRWLDPTKQRALIALAIRVIGAAIAYGMQILLAQWMGLVEYGVFVGVWVWLIIFGGVAPLGFSVSSIGLLSSFHDTGDLDRWRGLLLTSVAMTLGAGLVLAGVGWSTLYFSPGLLSDQYLMPVWLCLFCVPLLALSEINEGISRAHGWMNTALVPTYLLRPSLLVVGAYVAAQLGASLDATLVMSIAILACVLTLVAQSIVLGVRLIRIGGKGGSISATPVVWLFASLPIVVTRTFELITQNFDMIAVSYFLGPEKTGIYFAALKTIALVAFVNFAVGAATANRVASLHAAGKRKDLEDVLSGATNMAFWPTLFGAFAVILCAPVLLSLFGKDFAAYAYLTAVLAVGFVAKSFVGPAELYLNVLGQQKACALMLMIAAVSNIVLNIVLVPFAGLLGAAIATSVSLIVLAISLFVVMRRRVGVVLRPTIPMTSLRQLIGRKRVPDVS